VERENECVGEWEWLGDVCAKREEGMVVVVVFEGGLLRVLVRVW
jgi:hypothetical protein